MTVKLNKEEVAARQLDMAIELLFSGRDIVSVHTLAAASSQVFADLIKDKGHKNWRQEMVDCFKDVFPKISSNTRIEIQQK